MNRLALPLNRYRYDALDVLVEIEPSGLEKLRRFYRAGHLVTQLDSQGPHSVFQHGRQLLAMRSAEGADSISQLLVTDAQRSVLSHGAVRQVYSPYGHRLTDSGLGSLLGFTGEAVDPITGHYLLGNGHRAFNPVLMRFNSPDRLSPFGRGGLNPYAYCAGDPVNFTDPTGRVAGLITSIMSLSNTVIGLHRSIPSFNLAADALRWGAIGKLPFKPAFAAGTAVATTAAGLTTGLLGVASAVVAITEDTETAKILGYIALGLTALALASRVGTHWAVRDPRTEKTLSRFVSNKGQATVVTPSASPRNSFELSPASGRQSVSPESAISQSSNIPSAPEISHSPIPSAPRLSVIEDPLYDYSWMRPDIRGPLNKLGRGSNRKFMADIRDT